MEDKIKKPVLFVTVLGSFLVAFMGSSLNIALPTIAEEFHMEAVYLSWIATSYLLATAVFLVPMGKIADIKGRRKIYLYGMVIYTISSLLCMTSFSTLSLIFFRTIQGFGAGMIFSTSLAIVTSAFPKNERGKAIGISSSATYVGLSFGPILGGFFTHSLDWRLIFLINSIAGLVAIYVIVTKVKVEWKEEVSGNFDYIGSVLFGLIMLIVMYGVSILPDVSGILILAIGFVLVPVFIYWENKTPNPVLNVSLFRHNITFSLSNVSHLINHSAAFAVGFLLSLYLQYSEGYSPQEAGFILIVQPIAMSIFAPFAGRLSDKIEPRVIASIGLTITIIGQIFFVILGKDVSIFCIIFGLILLGSGLALFSAPNANAIMSSVDAKYYSIASASVGTMRLMGQMLSMAIITILFVTYIGNVKITPSKYPDFIISMKVGLLIFSGLCFVGIFASLARGKVHQN